MVSTLSRIPEYYEKSTMSHEECRQGAAHLPYLGLEPTGDKPLKSVMHGQYDVVTIPVALLLVSNYTEW